MTHPEHEPLLPPLSVEGWERIVSWGATPLAEVRQRFGLLSETRLSGGFIRTQMTQLCFIDFSQDGVAQCLMHTEPDIPTHAGAVIGMPLAAALRKHTPLGLMGCQPHPVLQGSYLAYEREPAFGGALPYTRRPRLRRERVLYLETDSSPRKLVVRMRSGFDDCISLSD